MATDCELLRRTWDPVWLLIFGVACVLFIMSFVLDFARADMIGVAFNIMFIWSSYLWMTDNQKREWVTFHADRFVVCTFGFALLVMAWAFMTDIEGVRECAGLHGDRTEAWRECVNKVGTPE